MKVAHEQTKKRRKGTLTLKDRGDAKHYSVPELIARDREEIDRKEREAAEAQQN